MIDRSIAVIPARGGSKRIPRKNIRTFAGKPMIAWSIEVALESGIFAHVVVSTDDEEIAHVSRSFGAEVPFMRPASLSDDHTGTTAVVAHATEWAIEKGWNPAAVCCLYATAPFVRISDLARGYEILTSSNWDFAFSVAEFAAPIFRSFRTTAGGGIEMFFPEYYETRSQDLPRAFHDAGQFYWGRAEAWLQGKQVFDRLSAPVVIPRWRVQDIDTEDDWKRAEHLFRLLSQNPEE